MAVIDSIFDLASRAPDRVAVIYNGERIGYRRFAAAILAARRFFADQGIARDRVAIVCAPHLLEAWVVGLGLRSLGVTTVTGRSVEEVAGLALERPSVIGTPDVAGFALQSAAEQVGGSFIATPHRFSELDGDRPDVSADGFEAPGGHILLTSGTTGEFKKVLVEAWIDALRTPRNADLWGVDADSVVSVLNLGSWTGGCYNMCVCAWSLGATIVMQTEDGLWRSVAMPGLTHLITQPQLLAALLAAPAEVDMRNDGLTVIVGGGVLSEPQWRATQARITNDVRAIFASTEVGPITITHIEGPEDLVWHRVHPAHAVQVVDAADRPLPAGEEGALRVRMLGVEGYLGDPDASAGAFRHGWFYPGDVGVLDAGGRLQLRGRGADVVNVMGSKFATTPIETALAARLGARSVCLLAVPADGAGDLHVFIERGQPVSKEALKGALTALLPGVPRFLVHPVETLPRNAMGKIDRNALRAQLPPARDGATPSSSFPAGAKRNAGDP
jgi:acyl-coenzyme A synthetase/AMP-(fatty) acid ligase